MYSRHISRHSSPRRSWLPIALVGAVFLVILSWMLVGRTGQTPVNITRVISFHEGATISHLPQLAQADISTLRYKLWTKIVAPKITLKQGSFEIPDGTDTLEELFEVLQDPVQTEAEITLLPGWHKGEIAAAFVEVGIAGDLVTEESEILSHFRDTYPFLANVASLEGFLMPDTYRISGGESVYDVVQKMLDNFEKRIYQPYLQTGKPVASLYDVLTLASIVQEEENSASQIPLVADILKKRLRQGWAIGADITVCYPDLIPGKECQKYVNQYYAGGNRDNSYDTRFTTGLPPTPIASISGPTFFATLDAPATTGAWYYLHDTSGVIHTAITNAEHEANKTKYLR